MPSPIALFVYNRPLHARQTVEALKQNGLSKDSDLFIFSDAPKMEAQAEAVNEVRQYIRQIDGFKSVTIVERQTNYGLARSIIEGVTMLCEDYGRVIVLEDDLVTSPHFLKFMNEALVMYEHEDRVMHISGSRYPVESFGTNDTFFLHVPLCWGWGTWKRAWSTFEKDTSFMNRFDKEMMRNFNFDNTYPYWAQLELNQSGELDTWFVFWYANIFLRNAFCLFPSSSLVRNIGFDGSGIHCNKTSVFDTNMSLKPIKVENIPVVESKAGYEKHKEYFQKLKPNQLKQILRKILNTTTKLIS